MIALEIADSVIHDFVIKRNWLLFIGISSVGVGNLERHSLPKSAAF